MTKRRRTDGSSTTIDSDENQPEGTEAPKLVEEPAIQSDIWLSDGNVILKAENTLFKVHKSVLSRHSTVFSDVFSLPQPHGEPTLDGCPIVVLQDRAEDIRHMLLALYDRCYHKDGPIPIAAVAAMLRMGKKYDMRDLRDDALSRIKHELPSRSEKTRIDLRGSHIASEDRLLFKIINLALEFSIQTSLPQAYLLCSILGEAHYLQIEDESSRLPDAVQRQITLARPSLIKAYTNLFEWIDDLGDEDEECTGNRCKEPKPHLLALLWRPAPKLDFLLRDWNEVSSYFDFCYVDQDYRHHTLESLLCRTCYDEVAECSFRSAQKAFWENLPSTFGFKDWSSLKDFDGS